MSPQSILKQIFLRENRQLNVLVATLFMGLMLWVVDSLLGATFFYKDMTFVELLATEIPHSVMYTRAVVILSWLVFGMVISQVVGKQQRAEEALASSHNALEKRVEERTSELSNANKELEKHRHHLEDMIEERASELQATNQKLAGEVGERKKAVEALSRSYEQLRTMLTATVTTLTSAVEVRDPYTAGHQKRVAELACAIAEELDLDSETVDGLRLSGILHDIGKISVPTEILVRPGKITDTEFSLIQHHSEVGAELLGGIDFQWPVAEIVRQHHERMDGSGYPDGLKGDEIRIEAKILGVADVVESMASHRPYRPALGMDKAIEEITKRKGDYFDPDVVDACVRLLEKNNKSLDNLTGRPA